MPCICDLAVIFTHLGGQGEPLSPGEGIPSWLRPMTQVQPQYRGNRDAVTKSSIDFARNGEVAPDAEEQLHLSLLFFGAWL